MKLTHTICDFDLMTFALTILFKQKFFLYQILVNAKVNDLEFTAVSFLFMILCRVCFQFQIFLKIIIIII